PPAANTVANGSSPSASIEAAEPVNEAVDAVPTSAEMVDSTASTTANPAVAAEDSVATKASDTPVVAAEPVSVEREEAASSSTPPVESPVAVASEDVAAESEVAPPAAAEPQNTAAPARPADLQAAVHAIA